MIRLHSTSSCDNELAFVLKTHRHSLNHCKLPQNRRLEKSGKTFSASFNTEPQCECTERTFLLKSTVNVIFYPHLLLIYTKNGYYSAMVVFCNVFSFLRWATAL